MKIASTAMIKPPERLSPDIEVIPAAAEQEPTLANLLQLYAHDFSELHRLEMDGARKLGDMIPISRRASPGVVDQTEPPIWEKRKSVEVRTRVRLVFDMQRSKCQLRRNFHETFTETPVHETPKANPPCTQHEFRRLVGEQFWFALVSRKRTRRNSHMLGWNISIYRQTDGGSSPATHESPAGIRLAVWQTRRYGLDWLDELAKEGKAINLGGNGYPNCYTAPAEYMIPRILDKLPEALDNWASDEHDILLPSWVGKTLIDVAAAKQCRFDEWLLVVAWDES